MTDDLSKLGDEEAGIEAVRSELVNSEQPRWRRIVEKFLLAAIGSIPWVGGFLAAAASIPGEEAGRRADHLRTQWLDEHRRKLDQLRATLHDISERFRMLGPEIEERIQSQEYLALVRQAFRTWDEAETDEKRRYAANLITNAAGTRLCSDDVVRLFISWVSLYHEAHFSIIRAPGFHALRHVE